MTQDQQAMQKAIRTVLAMLPQDRQATDSEVDDAVGMVWGMFQKKGDALDRQALGREILALVAVWQDESVGLENNDGHIEWLSDAKADGSWEFWERYRVPRGRGEPAAWVVRRSTRPRTTSEQAGGPTAIRALAS